MAGGDEVVGALRAWSERRRAAVIALAQNWGGQLEKRAKTGASWQDRTANARNGLQGKAIVKPAVVIIALAHSIDYGVYLELANSGKYAILKPTIDNSVSEIYKDYERLWRT